MADTFAEEGYTTLIADVFNGDTFPGFGPGFDIMEWFAKGSDGNNPHTKEAVDPITVAGIEALKGMGFKKIGAVGYCFGGKV